MKDDTVASFFDRLADKWDEGNSLPPIDLIKLSGIKEGNKVLDVACGTGIITPLLHSLCHTPVLGIDISEKMIDKAKANHDGEEGISFQNIDFCEFDGKETYDLVVVYNAFPHFVDRNAFKKALLKTLKTGGKAAILHSLSRKQLEKHHDGLGPKISRDLASPQEEAIFFEPEFETLTAEESDHYYALVLRKN